MWIEWNIAVKFLREGRSQTALILVGIAVGVSVIVFITALITGLQANIIERTLGTQAHIKIQSPDEVNRVLPAAVGTTQLVLEDKRPQRLRSSMVTLAPCRNNSRAVTSPAIPPPITITSLKN